MSSNAVLPLSPAWVRHHESAVLPWMKHCTESGQVSPVLLLTGPDGCGKREVAYWLSQWLLCERNGPSAGAAGAAEGDLFGGLMAAPASRTDTPYEPCGECSLCLKATKQSWVDFSEISPDDSGSIKIEEFRKLLSSLGFRAFDGTYRITLIRNAERMTVAAANSLLKTLEEPPAGFIFLLTATDPSLLLPTLVSRCQRLRLRAPNDLVLSEVLGAAATAAGSDENILRKAIVEARGNLHRARAALEPAYWESRQGFLQFLGQPWSSLEGLVSASSGEDENADQLLHQIETTAHQLISWACTPEAERQDFSALAHALRPHAADVLKRTGSLKAARDFWLARSERAFRARSEVLLPLNRKLLLQEILSPWAS